MITLDATTLSSYLAASTSDARAQAVIDSLSGTVYVRVYDGSNTLMGEGTMSAPWATRSGSVITVGEVSSFTVLQSGTPNAANWYLRFETAGGRWVRGPFGAGGNFTWSLGSTWNAGAHGSLGTVTLNAKGTIQLVGAAIASAVGSAGLTVSSGGGGYAHGDLVTITGSGFGTRAQPKPLLWAPADGSINPSSLGVVTSWTETQAVEYAAGEGAFGGGAIKASDSSGSWTAGIIASGVVWNSYGQRMYCFRRVKQNFDITADLNWKIIRFWPAAITTPDWFIQAGNANLNVEGIDGSDTYPYDPGITSPISGGNIAAVRGTVNTWKTEQILMRANSAASAYDGEFYHYVLGSGLVGVLPHTTYTSKTIRLRSGDGETDMTLAYPVHAVKANTTFPSDYRHWTDDVYLDTHWSRVMIGDSATYSACTFLAPQPPTAWADTSVTVSLNLDGFPSGSTRYLHVIDDTNTVRQTINIGVHP